VHVWVRGFCSHPPRPHLHSMMMGHLVQCGLVP
jgi:hypothetical protein